MKFKFGDIVKINIAFYENSVGAVIDYRDSGMRAQDSDGNEVAYKIILRSRNAEDRQWFRESELQKADNDWAPLK